MPSSRKSIRESLKGAYHTSIRIVVSSFRKYESLRMRRGKARMPLAQTLPMEVLEQIFIQCHQRDRPVVYLPPLHGSYYPWRLGRVCSHWRAALWHSSEVWSMIRLEGLHREEVVWDVLDYILSRTTGLITISISQYLYNRARLTHLLRASNHRFRNLAVTSIPHEQMDTLLSLSKGSFRYLEDLSLHHVYPKFQSSSTLGTHGGQCFGSLQRLAISGNCSVTPYIPHFPLFQLTELSITGCMVTPTITHYILQQCTSLTVGHFSIGKRISGAFDYRSSGSVRSPLKSLTLALYLILDWDLFLAPLVLPSLVSFTNADYSKAPTSLSPMFSRAMRALIIRSNCSLQSLCLSPHAVANTDFSYPEIAALLQKAPRLETLTLRGNIMEPDLIRLIHELLPQLRVIDWRVRPDGLHTFLDILERYLADTSVPKGCFPDDVNIICEHHEDMSSVRARYAKSYETYKDAGIYITVLDTLGNDMRRWKGLGGGESVLTGQ